MYVVAVGNVWDGVTLYGPYKDITLATAAALSITSGLDYDYEIIMLREA